MKLKIAIASAVIALSAQASFAATDTSCNPFERGVDCNGAVAAGVSSSNGSSFGQFMSNFRARGQAVSFIEPAAQSEEQQLGRMMRTLSEAVREQVVVLDDVDLGEGEVIEIADEVETDGGEDVSVVPVPAAGFLLLAGLGGLVAMRRKQS